MGDRALMAAAGVLALLVFLPLSAPDLGLSLPAAGGSSLTDSSAVQIVGPGLGAPGGGGWLASSLVPALALLWPVGAPAARLGGLAVLAGLLAVILTFRLYRRLALSAPSALIGAVVTATGGTLLSLVTTGSHDAVMAPFVPGLLLCGLWWGEAGRPVPLAVLAGLIFLGVGSYPALGVVVGGVVAAIMVRPAADRVRPVAVTLGAALLGLTHRVVATRLAARAAADGLDQAPGTEPLVSGAWDVVLGGPRLDAIGDRAASLGALFTGELGLLGLVLALLGLATLGARARVSGLVWSWALGVAWVVTWSSATPESGSRVVALLSWLLVGLGLDWLWRSSATSGARLGAVAVGVLVAGAGVAEHRNLTPWSAELGGATYGIRLRQTLPAGVSLVAERPLLDRALAASAGAGSGAIPRLPLDPPVLKRRHDTGLPVAVLSGARDRLERLGLQFEAVPVPADRVGLGRLLAALPRGAIVAVAAGPALGRWVAPRSGPLFGDIGGVTELFGVGGEFYGAVGVVGRDGLALERRSADGVEFEVPIGDSVGSFPVRVMSALRVTSDRDGGRITVADRVRARTRAGLALVAMAPDGRVLAAVGDELEHGLALPVSAAEPAVSRLIGWEPCVTVSAGEWLPLDRAVAAGAFGGQLPASGGTVVVYLAGRVDREVRVRPSDASRAGLSVTAYRLDSADDRDGLRVQLQADGAPFGAMLMDAAHVRRLELTTTAPLSVELGEVPLAAYARYEPWAVGVGAVDVCGAVSGEPRFDAGAPRVTRVPPADLQAVGWGWHGLERDARGPFRWSAGPETELLVQLVQTGPIRVEIDAAAAAVDLSGESVTAMLVVNGTELTPQPMTRDVQTYAWDVPPTAWKTGMNRIGLRVSATVSPQVLGLSDDRRTLGMALRRLELALLE